MHDKNGNRGVHLETTEDGSRILTCDKNGNRGVQISTTIEGNVVTTYYYNGNPGISMVTTPKWSELGIFDEKGQTGKVYSYK